MNLNNLNSISFDEVKSHLSNYVKSLPDYENRWKDFYIAGAGETVLDVGAAITALLGFAAQSNRKNSTLYENYIKSEAVAIASALGYYFNRKAATRIRLTFNSDIESFWSKEIPIGTYGKYNLVLTEDKRIESGSNTVEVALGDWNSSEQEIKDVSDYLSLFFEGDIDNNLVEFKLNEETLSPVRLLSKSNSDTILIRSMTSGIYLIFGNGLIGRKPEFGDKLKVSYLTPSLIALDGRIDGSELQLSIGSITYWKITDYGSNEDSLEKVKAAAPGFRYSNGLLTSISDYRNISLTYEGLVSTNAVSRSNSCCAVNVAYLREDEQIFTPQMRENFYLYLEQHAILGTSFFIEDPEKIDVDYKINVIIDKSANTAELKSKITDLINSMCLKLGSSFQPNKLLSKDFICELEHVDRIYLEYPIKDKQASYKEYFALRNLEIKFTQKDIDEAYSNGTDSSLGYSKNGEKY